ncbi:MAG TPA: 3-deoxy-manno-octulosonate cytidylyltransferase, partial [Polyangiaceae bacterium LLY-WYZ-15_(1-7)]|nr:3-deoxy-manno-octulosonate cytidylyltransferase [Polyangiaceae bacterium LLY-WYZ-15_(1-7)]
MSFHVVIPARYASTRLPGKPLAEIGGEPMVLHVLERAREAIALGAESIATTAEPGEVIVATDDERVYAAVVDAGGEARMTHAEHTSGTDRIAEVARACEWRPGAMVVNLQGDEPLMPPELLVRLAEALEAHPDAGVATMAVPITDPQTLFSPHVVKTVLDEDGYALYFSRAPIPWVRDAFAGGPPDALPEGAPFLRHLGLYAYRVATLEALAGAPPVPLERAESLEQLRAM